ncbi:MAG: DUF6516 family protein [Anaerolineae bacterium]
MQCLCRATGSGSTFWSYAGARIRLVDGGLLELFERVTADPDGTLTIKKYRYHWQDANDKVIRRWDNAAHHQHLPYTPHHVHLPDGSVEGVADPPDALEVLDQIEAKLGRSE